MAISFITTTSHGTWLPGDVRGYVRKGVILPGDAKLWEHSQKNLKSPPVYFSRAEREKLFASLVAACSEFHYRLSDAAVEPSHLHWMLFHDEDPIEIVAGRLKNRMRQALARGRIWIEGYCGEPLFDEVEIAQAQEYIARHEGCMMLDGRILDGRIIGGADPRQSRGLSAAQ